MNYLLKIPSNFRGTYPRLGKTFLAGSLVLLTLSGYHWASSFSAQRQIEWRKSQLTLPVYTLSEQEHINPPWNADNINEWLYRRVEVGGRLLHRSQMPLLTNVNGADGYELVVPLLVKEEAKRANQQGLIFSRGFMPYRHHDIGTRYRIENAKYQKFIGFVSQLPELQNTTFFDGNSVDDEKIKFTCADCEDFAKSSGFVNSKQAGVAIIEQLHQTEGKGKLDQTNSYRRWGGCEGTQNYPYVKTEAGALQLRTMPWQHKNDSKKLFLASLFSAVLGASVF